MALFQQLQGLARNGVRSPAVGNPPDAQPVVYPGRNYKENRRGNSTKSVFQRPLSFSLIMESIRNSLLASTYQSNHGVISKITPLLPLPPSETAP
jgi:hypothetical protein